MRIFGDISFNSTLTAKPPIRLDIIGITASLKDGSVLVVRERGETDTIDLTTGKPQWTEILNTVLLVELGEERLVEMNRGSLYDRDLPLLLFSIVASSSRINPIVRSTAPALLRCQRTAAAAIPSRCALSSSKLTTSRCNANSSAT